MLKKIIAISLVTSFAGFANASENPGNSYLKVGYSYGFPQKNHLDIQANTSNYKKKHHDQMELGFGGNIQDNFRNEITISHINNNNINVYASGPAITTRYKTGIKSTYGLVSFIYDFYEVSPSATPFIGFGIGATSNKMHTIKRVNTTTGAVSQLRGGTKGHFAYRATVGFALPLAENVKFDIGYNYVNLGKAKSKSGINTKRLESHQAMANLRFLLNR